MPNKLVQAAIIYDFDGTLSPINMQEHDFIDKLGMSSKDFWDKTKAMAKDNNASEILCYMHLMLKEATSRDVPVGRNIISDYGKGIELFEGVQTWFDRVNKHAQTKGIKLSHYVISSGIKPLIEGTSIAQHFEEIFACDYIYDCDGKPVSPGVAVDYTAKTQYIFRINKGCLNQWDDSMINDFVSMEKRPIPIKNMIYIGDGPTDIPAMKMTKHYGGLSICVYKPRDSKKKNHAYKLLRDGRADCVARADYKEGKALEKIVLSRIDQIAASSKFERVRLRHISP